MDRRKLPVFKSCLSCGASLPGDLTAGQPRRYCDRKCAQDLRVRRDREARKKNVNCRWCKKEFLPKTLQIKYCSADCRAEANRANMRAAWEREKLNRPKFRVYPCGWCGEEMVMPYKSRAYGKFHDECKKQSRRVHNRIKTLRRQSVKTDLRVTHEEIAERDNFVCHICNKLVDMSLPRTDKQGATIDHVIPISRGGTDSLDNLKLAHWSCNMKKSNKFMEELVV
jgi:5-methylcytosine-specific restriction endonuclease McrA